MLIKERRRQKIISQNYCVDYAYGNRHSRRVDSPPSPSSFVICVVRWSMELGILFFTNPNVTVTSWKLSHYRSYITPRILASKTSGQQLHRFWPPANDTKSTHLHCRSHFVSHYGRRQHSHSVQKVQDRLLFPSC
jgi:hypothetical protein